MTLLYVFLALIAFVLIVFAADRDGFWERLAGNPDLGQTDFRTLQPARKPNEALACPPANVVDFCPNRTPDIETGAYALSAEKLGEKVLETMAALPLVRRVDEGQTAERLRFLRRTAIMRFPDTFSIELIPLGNDRSTLAIHGKAQLGRTDLQNNLALTREILLPLEPFRAGN